MNTNTRRITEQDCTHIAAFTIAIKVEENWEQIKCVRVSKDHVLITQTRWMFLENLMIPVTAPNTDPMWWANDNTSMNPCIEQVEEVLKTIFKDRNLEMEII